MSDKQPTVDPLLGPLVNIGQHRTRACQLLETFDINYQPRHQNLPGMTLLEVQRRRDWTHPTSSAITADPKVDADSMVPMDSIGAGEQVGIAVANAHAFRDDDLHRAGKKPILKLNPCPAAISNWSHRHSMLLTESTMHGLAQLWLRIYPEL